MILKQFVFTLILTFNLSCSTGGKNQKNERPKKAELYYGQGTEMLVKKDYSRALEYLLEAQKITPNDTEIQNNLGMAYFFKGRAEKAKQHLKRAIEINPKNSNARNNLAGILFREKNFKNAKNQYEMVKDDLIYQHQYRTYYNLALIAEIEGKYKETIRLLNESISERKEFCPSHYKLGEISLAKKQLSEALKHFRNASRGTCYKNAGPLYFQASIYRQLAAQDKATAKLTEILDNFPEPFFVKKALVMLEEIKKNSPELREKIQLTVDNYNKNSLDKL